MKFTIPGSILVAASYLPSFNDFSRFQPGGGTWRIGIGLIFIGIAITFSEHIPANISKLQRLAWAFGFACIISLLGAVCSDERSLFIAIPATAFIYFWSISQKLCAKPHLP
jgi:hypothetical protein